MFSEDGAFEMPYLESFGLAGRYEGREAIQGFFRFAREIYPDIGLENIKVMIDTPEPLPSTSSPRSRARPDAPSTSSSSGAWSQRRARSSSFANQ